MSATWTVIPWTILKDMTMTYAELREVLMSMDEEQTLDPNHFVITF